MTSIGPGVQQTVRRVGWIALAAAVFTVGLMTFGAWVRASGSGLGCPDWPLCHGNIVPELQGDTAIEYGHRFYAGVVMLTVAVGAFLSYRVRLADRRLAWLMFGALGVILLQALLGGITVLTELHGAVRFAHLLTAMLTLGLLTAAAIRGLGIQPSVSPGLPIASGLLALNIVVIIAGGLIVWQAIGPGCPGLPLCDDRSTGEATWLHGIHRSAAALLVLALLATAVRMMRVRGTKLSTALNHGAAFLAVSQILIGVLAVMHFLPEGLRVLHVGVATLIWWCIVAQWVLAYRARAV